MLLNKILHGNNLKTIPPYYTITNNLLSSEASQVLEHKPQEKRQQNDYKLQISHVGSDYPFISSVGTSTTEEISTPELV